MDCSPQGLVTTAEPLQAIPDGYQLSQLVALFAQWANMKVDPNTLSNEARCIACGIPAGLQMDVLIALMCNIVENGGGTGGVSITIPDDTDAADFFCYLLTICTAATGCVVRGTCAPGSTVVIPDACTADCGLTQPVVTALGTLVTSLKAAGLWDLMDVIYPFVGGTSLTCSLNLKNPAAFSIAWHGGVTFSSAGAIGDGATGYGDTSYVPSVDGTNFTLNSAAIGFYVNGSNEADIMGAYSIISSGAKIRNSNVGVVGFINNNTPAGPIVYGSPAAGNYVISRTAANLTTLYVPSGSTAGEATAPIGVTAFSLYVLSAQFSGIPSDYSNATMGFAFAGAGLSGAQIATLSGIVNTFIAAK